MIDGDLIKVAGRLPTPQNPGMDEKKKQRQCPGPPSGWVDFDAAGPELTEEDDAILDCIWDKAKDMPMGSSDALGVNNPEEE